MAYLLDSFPRLSETFIINEILEVKRQGLEVKIFARRKIDDGVSHRGGQLLAQETHYLPPLEGVNKIRIYLFHLYFLLRFPLSYIRTFLFALRRRKKGTLWFLKMAVIYALPISKSKPDHIHSHFAGVASEYAMLISMLLNIPYTFTAHGYYDIYEEPSEDFEDRGKIAKKVITISEYNKKYIHKAFHIPLEKIEVIHCGVNSNFLSSQEKKLHKDSTILSVARLHPVKGLEYLIRACKILKEKRNHFKCLIVGDGEERAKLERLTEDLQLKDFVFLEGAKAHEEVENYYAWAKVFVQPSLQETMGVAAMEAMAHGIPVIATDVYGVPELIQHGGNGYLVKPKDPEGIARYLEILLSNDEQCRRLGHNGLRKIREDFNLQKEVSKLIKIWFEDYDSQGKRYHSCI